MGSEEAVRHVENIPKEGCDGGAQPPEQTDLRPTSAPSNPAFVQCFVLVQMKNGRFSVKSQGLLC